MNKERRAGIGLTNMPILANFRQGSKMDINPKIERGYGVNGETQFLIVRGWVFVFLRAGAWQKTAKAHQLKYG